MRLRDGLVAATIAAVVAAVQPAPLFDDFRALSLDALFWARDRVFGQRHTPESSPVVVVAIDEETRRRPPFADIPAALWTANVGRVLTALVDADAAVVGFDAIFPASAERFAPGSEREFLVALRAAAQRGKVVLGKVQHQKLPISPFRAQSLAVGNERNIRATNLLADGDEAIRRVPLHFEAVTVSGGTRREASMALELAARGSGLAPEATADGGVRLGRYRIPGSERNALLVNFDGGNDVPTYSLADLFACAERGEAEFFRRHFAGRIVLVGAVEDLEDRKITAKRFMTAPDDTAFARCVYPPLDLVRTDVVRDTLPGVYVHAAAVANLVRGEALRQLPTVGVFLLGLALSGIAASCGMALRPLAASLAIAGVAAAASAAAILALREALFVPILPPLAGMLVVFGCELAWRFVVADRDKRLLRKSFGLYLAPVEIDRMLRAEKPPGLGGEQRRVTVLFSDVAGFSSFSEQLSPAELVALMNEYLSAMTDVVEAHRGFVDNFIGDAIVAVFGAPVEDPEHATNAVRCALACRTKLAELNRGTPAFAARPLAARIGINTGDVLVGNIGSRRRLKYTVMGDAVNLAARLEGANKAYRTSILVAEETVAAVAGSGIPFREIDRVRVKGRRAPVTVFEPLSAESDASPSSVAAFAAALAQYRAGRFAEAAAAFGAAAHRDPAAAAFAERAHALAMRPPAQWDAVTALETK